MAKPPPAEPCSTVAPRRPPHTSLQPLAVRWCSIATPAVVASPVVAYVGHWRVQDCHRHGCAPSQHHECYCMLQCSATPPGGAPSQHRLPPHLPLQHPMLSTKLQCSAAAGTVVLHCSTPTATACFTAATHHVGVGPSEHGAAPRRRSDAP
ncbi:hypothetical protein D1007_26449 [Hordeum vulgare]|nr:hypothetical protein D1007_26449 [Hordeum vulgare]